jgi:hypothetical protein
LLAGVTLAGLFLLYQLWHWEVERVEVPPDSFLVRINLWGKDLPEGDILAPDDSFKGVQKDVMPEGRHFLNPILYRYEKYPVTIVPPGKCLVLTRKAGSEIPAERLTSGDFLAREGERGIVREVLLPGKHRINPYEYTAQLIDAVEIRTNQVGVRTVKWGDDPPAGRKDPYVVPLRRNGRPYRGVQEKPVRPGTYYLNPYAEAIVPVDIRSHPVEFTDISFPSRDGFQIKPHVLVAYKVVPAKAPHLFVTLCDQGLLHQQSATEEQKKSNEILKKVVLPLIRGYVRIEGSKYDARDYISQAKGPAAALAVNPRERLQRELMNKVTGPCEELGILIESITVAQIEMGTALTQLADQIAQREQARITREKNKELVAQHKQEQELKAKEALVEQKRAVVDAGTRLEVETEKAKQLKEVEKARLEQELEAAQTRLEAAKDQALAVVTRGEAEAAVIKADNEAQVAGLKTAVLGFPSPEQFAQYHVVSRLAPALAEIFASDSSDFARVFAAYMTPTRSATTPVGAGGSRVARPKP